MTSRPSGDPTRLLVVAPSWLGDAVMSLPALQSLARTGSSVCVVASPYTARVYWGSTDIDQLLVLRRDGWSRNVLGRAKSLRETRSQGAAILPPSFSSALMVRLAGIPERVGFGADARAALLTAALAATGSREEHVSSNYQRVVATLCDRVGLVYDRMNGDPVIHVTDAERASVERLLSAAGAGGESLAVLVPGATYGNTKSWPSVRYRELARTLAANMRVIVAGSARERDLCRFVADADDSVVSLAGNTSLGELFALVEAATVVVANDSGVPHVSAALGTPTVVIFGSTSPTWTLPMGPRVHEVRAPVACAPCFLERCPTQLECYDGIAPSMVLDVIREATAGSSQTGLQHS